MAVRRQQIDGSAGTTRRTATAPARPRTTRTASRTGNRYEQFLTMNDAPSGGELALRRPTALNEYNTRPTGYSNGMSEFDYLQGMLTGAGSQTSGGGGSSGGGRRGGGGGGGGSGAGGGVSPEYSEAYKAYLQSLEQQPNPYAGYGDRMKALYSDDPINQRFDELGGRVGAISTEALGRLGGIRDDLSSRTGQAASSIDQILSRAVAGVDPRAAEFRQAQSADASGLNNILSGFGAGSVQAESAPLEGLFDAQRGTLGSVRDLYGATMRDRASLGDALHGDVSSGLTREQANLMTQLNTQRTAGLDQNRQARQKLDADLFLQQQQYAAQQAQQLAEARLRAAELGITL